MLKLSLLPSRLFYALLVCVLIALVLGWAMLSWVHLKPPALGSYDHYGCEFVAGAPDKPVFRVMTPVAYFAPELADALCAQAILGAEFSRVDISWPARNSLQTNQLLDAHYQLIWNRAEVLSGLARDYQSIYAEIVRLPRYSVFLIGRQEQPQLTQTYFANKRLGLLSDQQSYSGYQLAMAALARAGISLTAEQLRLYPDRLSQYQALLRGDVDVISGLPYNERGEPIPPESLLLIADKVSSGGWFLHRHLQSNAMRCAVIKALESQSAMLAKIGKAEVENEGCLQ
jgi:hypothetical protein